MSPVPEFRFLFIFFHHYLLLVDVGCFPVAQLVEHGVSNAKVMGSIPRESKS